MIHNKLLIVFCIFLLNYIPYIELTQNDVGIKFKFHFYPYKKISGLENKFHGHYNRCSMKTDCQNYESEERQNCVLKCISDKCYEEIYSKNPLEMGEIDQRIQSFKGCVYIDLK